MKRTLILAAALLALPLAAAGQSVKEINKPVLENIDQVTPFHEGMAAVRQGNRWGFINEQGVLAIPFRNDLVWNESPNPGAQGVTSIEYPRFRDGRCPVKVVKEDGIPFYGYIDKTGKMAIEAEYLNLTEFNGGMAVGIYFRKTFRGKNNFQLNIYDYSFTEVILNPRGDMIWPLSERTNIMMDARRYERPELQTRILQPNLVAVKTGSRQWEIRKLDL
ncbi:WG repeat-containing protein [Robiginitalea sediminis]|uniref:WG repeat-containing protein n=1 Tax=Robiginitalea sediminis TaxID=1982593 RepID=UPI000B4B7762|nr:WG repeat-containing protein [Robiginitalea sediminis]